MELLSWIALGFFFPHVVYYSSLWLVPLPALQLPSSYAPLTLCQELQLIVRGRLSVSSLSAICSGKKWSLNYCSQTFITSNEWLSSAHTHTNATLKKKKKKVVFDDKHGLLYFSWQCSWWLPCLTQRRLLAVERRSTTTWLELTFSSN